jgi:hypothetical protein
MIAHSGTQPVTMMAEMEDCNFPAWKLMKRTLLQHTVVPPRFSSQESRRILDRMSRLDPTTAHQFGLKDVADSHVADPQAPLKLITDAIREDRERDPSMQPEFNSFIAVSYCWHRNDWKPIEGFQPDSASALPISRPMFQNILELRTSREEAV